MKTKNTIFAIVSAILPVAVSELVSKILPNISLVIRTAITFAISFLALWTMQWVLNKYNRLNKYCGQWVEEMVQYKGENETGDKFIGIGTIRHDHTTDEHTFIGRTYTLSGDEVYSWAIDYLRADRDDSMQYVCLVQNPLERSIGQITFHSKDECEGLIWCMNGIWYKYKAYRITKKTLDDLGLRKCLERFTWRPFYKGIVIGQKNCPEFVQKYSNNYFQADTNTGSTP